VGVPSPGFYHAGDSKGRIPEFSKGSRVRESGRGEKVPPVGIGARQWAKEVEEKYQIRVQVFLQKI